MSIGRSNPLLNLDGLSKYFTMLHQRSLDITIITFIELGIADRLVNALPTEGLTAEDISKEDNWNVDLIHRILRSCADAGIVENVNINNDDRHFILTSSGYLLTNNHPLHVRQFFQYQLNWLDYVRNHLTELVRQGENKNKESTCLNAYMAFARSDMNETLKTFMHAMDVLACESSDLLLTSPNTVDFSRFQSIVDCGGCNGAFLARLMEYYPNIKHGFIFDLPHTIEQTSTKHFQERNIDSTRYQFLKGNLIDSSTIPSDIDAYILKYVLDCYEDETVIQILSSIRQATWRNVNQYERFIFIIEDFILPIEEINKGENWMSNSLDVMLGGTADGKERTILQYKYIFTKSGLEFIKFYPIRAPSSIIEARILPKSSE